MSLEAKLHIVLHAASVILLLVAVIVLAGLGGHIDSVETDVNALNNKVAAFQQCVVDLNPSTAPIGFVTC